jgi:histidine triad (HIT) family protein
MARPGLFPRLARQHGRMPSLFSRIIVGDIPAQFVFKDAQWVAFLDIKPTNPGHALLVPRVEAQHLAELPEDVLAGLGPYLARLTATVKRASGAPAVNVVVNDGPAAGQEVPHAHIHVIPRHDGDGRRPFSVHLQYGEGELAQWGEKLRAAWDASGAHG